MITFGYVKGVESREDKTLWIKVRIPSVHGADSQKAYDGQTIRNYTADEDLPWYQSIYLPQTPKVGDIIALSTMNNANNEFLIIGITKAGDEG